MFEDRSESLAPSVAQTLMMMSALTPQHTQTIKIMKAAGITWRMMGSGLEQYIYSSVHTLLSGIFCTKEEPDRW